MWWLALSGRREEGSIQKQQNHATSIQPAETPGSHLVKKNIGRTYFRAY